MAQYKAMLSSCSIIGTHKFRDRHSFIYVTVSGMHAVVERWDIILREEFYGYKNKLGGL